MENLKVKVSSEVESKEVQELFFELGYKWFSGRNQVQHLKQSCSSSFGYLVAWSSGCFTDVIQCGCGNEDAKEITIPQLRDLGVLNRNNRNDRTHTDQDNWSWFISSNGTGYVFGAGNANGLHQWDESSLNMVDLKPIEKPMKEPKQAEFLVKTDSGYVLQVLDENAGGEDVVRVPDGADIAVKSNRGYIEFRKGNSFYAEEWCEGSWHVNDFPKHEWDIVWKRETLNDQVASAEEYRKMISNAAGIGLTSVVADIAQSCGGVGVDVSLQGQSDLNNSELNHRVAKAFNAVRETNLNEDDVNYLRELINLTISHYGERK